MLIDIGQNVTSNSSNAVYASFTHLTAGDITSNSSTTTYGTVTQLTAGDITSNSSTIAYNTVTARNAIGSTSSDVNGNLATTLSVGAYLNQTYSNSANRIELATVYATVDTGLAGVTEAEALRVTTQILGNTNYGSSFNIFGLAVRTAVGGNFTHSATNGLDAVHVWNHVTQNNPTVSNYVGGYFAGMISTSTFTITVPKSEGLRVTATSASNPFNAVELNGMEVIAPQGTNSTATNSFGVQIGRMVSASSTLTTNNSIGMAIDRQVGGTTKNIAMWISHLNGGAADSSAGLCFSPSADVCMWKQTTLVMGFSLGTSLQLSCAGCLVAIIASGGSVRLGSAVGTQKATTDTTGWPMMPTTAGTPTGAPSAAELGSSAFEWDRTNKKLCIYDTATTAWICMTTPMEFSELVRLVQLLLRTVLSAFSCFGLVFLYYLGRSLLAMRLRKTSPSYVYHQKPSHIFDV
jgi:hypothetical protein